MNKTIEKLKKLQESYILYTILIFLGLVGISFLLVKIIQNPVDLEETIISTCFCGLYFSPFLLMISVYNLNLSFREKAKNIIINDLIETYKNLKINIAYSPKKRYSKNINNDLLKFINDLLVLNTTNKEKYLYYVQYSYYRIFSLDLEDEFIIELEDSELKKLNIEVIEAFLKDQYYKSKKGTHEIKNFSGIILSTKLNTINNNNSINPIIIYENKIFIDPEDIRFFKYEKNTVLPSENNIINKFQNENQILTLQSDKSLEIVEYKDMNYSIYKLSTSNINVQINTQKNNIHKTIYILHPKNKELNSFEKIALKIAEKLYINNNFNNSFAVISNDILYIFLNHKDNIFKDQNILEIPFYLSLTTKKLDNTIQNIKNQIEIILKLVT